MPDPIPLSTSALNSKVVQGVQLTNQTVIDNAPKMNKHIPEALQNQAKALAADSAARAFAGTLELTMAAKTVVLKHIAKSPSTNGPLDAPALKAITQTEVAAALISAATQALDYDKLKTLYDGMNK